MRDPEMTQEELGHTLSSRTLELVEIASPSGREEAVADRVQQQLEAHESAVLVRRHGQAVVAGYGSERPRIVLVGHLDTVPRAGHPSPAIRGDEVVGLGTTDMKGALAVMLTLGELAGSRGERCPSRRNNPR